MPQITREYKFIVEHPRLIREIERCLKSWYANQSTDFPMFSSESTKEEIKEERASTHRENIRSLKQSIISVYPEFGDNKHHLLDYGRIQGILYFTLERELDIIAE